MPRQESGQPSARGTIRSASRSLFGPLAGAGWYAVDFAVEVAMFWAILLAVQVMLYGAGAGDYGDALMGLLVVAVAMGASEARFRLYRRVWTVAGLDDAIALALAVVEALALISIANFLMPAEFRAFHLAVPVLAGPAVFVAIGTYRLMPRLLSSGRRSGNRLLVVADSPAWHVSVKALMSGSQPEWSPVAILSPASADLHKTVMGVPVVGHPSDVGHWIDVTHADGIALVADDQRSAHRKELIAACLHAERPIFIVPSPGDWFHRQSGSRLRQLSADDLVGREPRELEVELARETVAGRTVLVTGAAGSIGSELSRLLSTLEPRSLILLDNNESGLFDIAEETRRIGGTDVREVLVSVVDRRRLHTVFGDERPDIVFHAAAYKHVPMLETHPDQALLVNAVGMRNTLRAADEFGASRFVLLSTDKATARHSIMGCTKRLAELLVLSHRGAASSWAVRFGNVVGSRGSVVPIFERQIAQGGPVTVTHPDMTRYMMTIREAASLVISSVQMASPGHVYMLDMGEPIRIHDLALSLIRARGWRPGKDIQVAIIGLRPGERLSEELLLPEEGVRPTSNRAIVDIVSSVIAGPEEVDWTFDQLEKLLFDGKSEEAVKLLRKSVQGNVTESLSPQGVSGEAQLPFLPQ